MEREKLTEKEAWNVKMEICRVEIVNHSRTHNILSTETKKFLHSKNHGGRMQRK